MWDDDQLLALLQDAMRESREVPPGFTEAGRNAFAWRGIDAELAQLRLDYIAAKTNADRHQMTEAIQRRFFEAAPYAYAGQYFPPVAYRKARLRGVIGLAAPVYWNMEKFAA